MDDLISRAAAIEAMTADNLSWNLDSVNDDDLKREARAAQRALARLPAAQRWISVTEKLPKNAGTYIICDCYGNVMSRHFCKKADGFAGYWHANGSKYYGNPTHWMPLPEPPEEDSNEV